MGTTWRQARELLGRLDPLPAMTVPLPAALGAVLAAPITAATDIPVADAAAAPGWAVAGQGPWTILAQAPADLSRGHAVAVAAGDTLPPGTAAVVNRGFVDRSAGRERLQVAAADGRPAAQPGLAHFGQGIASQGGQAASGDQLLPGGGVVTPAVLALAAAVGRDDLTVIPPATVALVLPAYGLARSGPQRPGRQRDTVAALLPAWLESGSARLLPARDTAAEPGAISAAVADADADVIVIAGGLARAVPAAVREAAELLGARPLIEALATDPGGATACYRLPSDRFLVTLPGGAAGTVAGLALVLEPLLAALARTTPPLDTALLSTDVPATATVLLPAHVERSELVIRVTPGGWTGPGGIRDLAAAGGLIVCEPGARAGAFVPLLPLPGAVSR